MSNPPRPPPPLHPPATQWRPPQVPPPLNGPWNYQPPPMYPNPISPFHPAFPNARPLRYPHTPNVPPLEVPPPNIPFANVPPPNLPPPVGMPIPVGIPPPMLVDPGFPPPNLPGIPLDLRFPVPGRCPMPEGQPPKDSRMAEDRDEDFLCDQSDTNYLLFDSNEENRFAESNSDIDIYSEMNSQEETDAFKDFPVEAPDELRSKIFQRASDILVRKKLDDDILGEITTENEVGFHSDQKNPSLDQEESEKDSNNIRSTDQAVNSDSKKRSVKSNIPRHGSSLNRKSSSSNHRTSLRDRAIKSPSRSKQNSSSHYRDKLSRSRKSPSQSKEFPNHPSRSYSKDRLSRNSSTRDYKDVRDIRRMSSRYDKTSKGELSDSRDSLGHRRSHEDRFSSRSKVPLDSRNRRSNEIDQSSAAEHHRRSVSSRDVKSSRSYRDRNRRDYDSDHRDSGYRKSRTDDRDSKSKTNGSSVKSSEKDKTNGSSVKSSGKDKTTTAPSSSEEDNPLKSLKKDRPKKAKSVNPKLKLYDNIWRKVRDKKLTSANQIKLTVGKLPLREKAEEGKECDVDEENIGITEKVASQVCSATKDGDNSEKPTNSSEPQQKDQSSKPNGDKTSDPRIVKRTYKMSNGTGIQPCLSCEPSKFIETTWAGTHYSKSGDSNEVHATEDLKELHSKFEYELIERGNRARARRPKYEPPKRKIKLREHKPVDSQRGDKSSSSSCSEGSSSEEEDTAWEELEKKRSHPDRLHPELWFNDPNEMNDGPLCRCSAKARRTGIRHGIYVGEGHLPPCDPHSNNAKRLYHYKICVKPVTNFLTKTPTYICYGKHMYIFEGFSMFSHKPLPVLPNSRVIRFNYEYTLMYVEEPMPVNFTVAGLELFSKFLFQEILELVDLDWKAHGDKDGCPQFHFMPRFARRKDDGKVLLSMHVVMEYLLRANKTLIDVEKLPELMSCSDKRWQEMADKVKGMIVTCPGMKPSSVRVDQLDREHIEPGHDRDYPVVVHFGVRPPQLSYAGNPLYQKAWRNYVKYRHLLANKPKVRYGDRHKLAQKEMKLQEMRMENDLKRDVTVVISSKGFYQTGLMSDMVQHAMLIPIMVCHLRFHASLTNLEQKIGYKFEDRFLLQLALTHPSYRENFGTNPDHARNSLTNCGLRQPEYGDRRIHYMNTRKRGINTLINIMSRFGREEESTSRINHNERLEFLGDAVVEFLSSTHLFYMFPDLEEGGLATYRAAIVQNQHLALLSKKLELDTFMLYAHGSDLCHDLELRHAMANCFEALMGALFLDAGIEVSDKVFSNTLFPEPELKEVWMNYPLHPLQEQEPDGDRRWIESIPLLQKINEFEEKIGIEFTHIRLLARALTHRSLGFNNLTLGSNQRLEFLGDTVLQLVASEYLYKFFPQHHEGHLSLLRSSLVNNRTQAVVCGDLGMVEYAIYPYVKVELKPKDKADLLEAFLGALYIDKDLGYCRKFCEVCFFPRLQDFIMNQDWNDPKSKLQQCCLTLRSMDGGEPDIPTYKVIECKGPTNTRVYGVAVYFQGNRLAVGEGHSIQQAEMDAAGNALAKSKDLFPQLKHQKRAIERSLKQGSKAKPREKAKKKRDKRKRL
ncbi:hypothetical protein JTE90_026377 [Oedothorax gibbosus]|uniref:Ribonuclease 3 n=1 Tax=Oedothorax gibbosus TaxID=931172 RepID=A0AAV6VFD5_9ARAC|nr:hypothetical protein JTE90_026377 [Oedothorax gibbosus]